MTGRRRSAPLFLVLVSVIVLGACSLRSHNTKSGGASRSVFKLHVGDCVMPPTDVKAEIDTVTVLPCSQPHTQETYALVAYDKGDTFPGDNALKTFADGACLQRYEQYVGIPYSDSHLFFTYLLPSARGWTDGKDRDVVCLVTTTGEKLTASVKDSKK